MDVSVQRQATHAVTASSHAAGGTAGSRSGSFMGLAVSEVPSAASVLAEVTRELGLSAAEVAGEPDLEDFEQDNKTEEERKERARKCRETLIEDQEMVRQTHALQDYLDSRQDKHDMQREIARFFSSPAQLYVALGYILSQMEGEEAGTAPPSSKAQTVRGLMADLEESEGPRLQAGMVAMLHGAGYADLDGSGSLSNLYARTVCDFTSVNEVFAHVQQQYGGKAFDRAVDFLFEALSADMNTHCPSMEMTHLTYVHANLGLVRLMQNVHDQCAALLARWERVHEMRHCQLTPLDMAGMLVDLRQTSYTGAVHMESIAARAEPPDVEREVLFLQELLGLVRGLPPRLYDGEEGYARVLGAAQEAVDKAVEREDQWLAGQSGQQDRAGQHDQGG